MKLKRFKERDNERIGVIIFTLVCLFLISGAVLYRTFAIFEVKTNQNVIKGTVQGMGDIEFAFYIDDKIVKTAPSISEKEKYVFDEEQSNCTNSATVYWDYQRWGPNVSNLTETKTKCYLKFKTEYSEPLLNGAVPELEGDLTPVTIDENGTVKKADVTQEWYNYGNQQWANAVITGNSYELLGSNVYGAKKENGYVHLDGQDDYIDLGLAGYDFSNLLTVSIRAKINDKNKMENLIGNQEAAGFVMWYYNERMNFDIYDGTQYQRNICTIENPEEYHIYTLKYNGQQFRAYIDGNECQSLDMTSNIIISSVPVVIGANPDSHGNHAAYSNIDVKQAAIFNRAIDENEIKDISNNFKITNERGLLKYVDFTNKTYEAGEVISEDNIERYFVWIPRYRYLLWNGEEETSKFTGIEHLGTIEDATKEAKLNQQQPIRIEFESKNMPVSRSTEKGEYLTHPAFTSFDSNGFWAGKFETGYKGATSTKEAEQNNQDVSKVIVKPNVYSWRSIQIANAFYTSKEYKENLDSHMMKNMEWGAVAYLTNSKYGRCKNNKCEEVRMNNNSNYVTGSSAVKAPTCGYTESSQECNQYGTDSSMVNSYDNPLSTESSTTGNYSGIYDMAGGAWEYVMGVMQAKASVSTPTTGPNVTNNSGFNGPYSNDDASQSGGKEWPSPQYYDLYGYNISNQYYNRGKLGDGTKEFGPFYSVSYKTENMETTNTRSVSEWNADGTYFVYDGNPWFIRGGHITDGTETGIVSFAYADGNVSSGTTFRIVLTP